MRARGCVYARAQRCVRARAAKTFVDFACSNTFVSSDTRPRAQRTRDTKKRTRIVTPRDIRRPRESARTLATKRSHVTLGNYVYTIFIADAQTFRDTQLFQTLRPRVEEVMSFHEWVDVRKLHICVEIIDHAIINK